MAILYSLRRIFTPFPHGHLVFISRREKVRRFVSVDDRFGVGGGQNIGKLPANGHHFLIRQKTAGSSLSSVSPSEIP
ncbi:MAG: hypothetical protein U0787_10370 [Polyangia bacterium]